MLQFVGFTKIEKFMHTLKLNLSPVKMKLN